MLGKVALRKARRAFVLEPADRAQQSEALRARLLSLDELVRAKVVALFAGIAHEPEMRGVFEDLAPRERWLPKVISREALSWTRVEDWASLRPGCLGIPEPSGDGSERLPPTLDAVLVPGVAFDASGGRLGWGGGYYDRLLASLPNAVRIGVTLDAGLVDVVPMDPHDQRMHVVVSPTRTIRLRSSVS